MITILYFARLKEVLGTGREELATDDIATVGALRASLIARGGAWADSLAEGKAVRAAVNQDMARAETPLRDGDEVAFFPPVTGG